MRHRPSFDTAGPRTRRRPLSSVRDDDQAIGDALRLSRAMTYKAACAGLDIGGGKAVIFGGAGVEKSEGRFSARSGRRSSLSPDGSSPACDMGITTADLRVMRKESQWDTRSGYEEGGSGESGAMTAYGVSLGIRACLEYLDGQRQPGGPPYRHRRRRQGGGPACGPPGGRRAPRLTVADIDQEKAERVAEACGGGGREPGEAYLLDVGTSSVRTRSATSSTPTWWTTSAAGSLRAGPTTSSPHR
ncbi:Glu/Leu/Phe/Val dehydrogenase dimerization domain-containing protein [Streptomyces lydicus]|uniref:Glu/Leu/Phe/Val dehydrogenase dimerization domain-containing protein n=1 Tax=Streptomyces lydicus TaxID=47763 RepID=UPI003D66AB09